MTLLTPQRPVITGKAPTYSAVTSSDTIKFTNQSSFLIVKNGSGAPVVVTVVVPGTIYGQPIPDVTVSVPATSGERWIGPFKSDMKDDATDLITVTYGSTTTVTAALVTL